MRTVLALALLAGGLGACGDQASPPADTTIMPARPDDRPVAQPSMPAPVPSPRGVATEAAPRPGNDSVAAPGRFQWTGRYAASAEMCRTNQDWRITNASVETAGETSCRIDQVQEVGSEVRLDLSCTAEGMPSKERWTLQPADGDRIRLRREGQGAPQELFLLYCEASG